MAIAFIVFAILFIVNIVNYNNFFVEAKKAGIEGVGGYFNSSEFSEMARKVGEAAGASDPVLYGSTILAATYTNYNGVYWYNTLNPNDVQINWIFMILMIVFGFYSIASIVASLILRKKLK